jgi:hypothetical protein
VGGLQGHTTVQRVGVGRSKRWPPRAYIC